MNASQSRFSVSRLLSRWWALDDRDRILVIEAFATLLFARAIIALVPFRAITRLLGDPSIERSAGTSPNLSASLASLSTRIAWSITAVARHSPSTMVCYPKCLAAALMLRRRKIPFRIYFGVKKDGSSSSPELLAHSWVEIHERSFFGDPQDHGFTPLLSISK